MEIEFPSMEIEFPLSEIEFPSEEIEFPPMEIEFPSMEIEFPSEEIQFPPMEIAFPSTEMRINPAENLISDAKEKIMAEECEALIRRWFEEVWNNRREDAIDEMFAEEGIANGLNDAEGNPVRGPEGFKTLHRAFLSAYPDLQITVEDIVCEGDKVAARCTVRATHAGEGLGLAATNQPVEFTGLTIVHVKDGKIVEAWNEFDFMKMYSQVGALTLKLQ